MDYDKIVGAIPDYQSFMTVDELDASTKKLAEEFPDTVSLSQIGSSRKGHPIYCIKIGNGPKTALMFACPHPNEPIGTMTCEYISRQLASDKALRDELGFTWYIIKCVDPDGTSLNEKWFKGPYTLYNYSKNFFRPVAKEQVEWTFPFHYKTWHWDSPLPETKALMDLMDRIKPDFIYSLHNAGFGGCYWYITKDIPQLYPDFYSAAKRQNIALSLGEPEAPYCTEFSPAVYAMLGMKEEYDYNEKYTGTPPEAICGTSSGDYGTSVNPKCITFLNELPYFFDSRIQDLSEGDMSRRDALLLNVRENDKHSAALEEILEPVRPFITKDNPFIKMVNMMIDDSKKSSVAKQNWAMANKEFEKPATVASIFDNTLVSKFYRGLMIGMTARSCEYELELLGENGKNGEAVSLLKTARDKASDRLKKQCEELEGEMNYSVIGIKRLVGVQTECGFHLAEYIRDHE